MDCERFSAFTKVSVSTLPFGFHVRNKGSQPLLCKNILMVTSISNFGILVHEKKTYVRTKRLHFELGSFSFFRQSTGHRHEIICLGKIMQVPVLDMKADGGF